MMSVYINVVLPEFYFEKKYDVECFYWFNLENFYETIIRELNYTVNKKQVEQALERFLERQNFEIDSEVFSQVFQFGKPLLQKIDDIARLSELETVIQEKEIPIQVLQYVFGQSSYYLKVFNLIYYFEGCEFYKASTYKEFVYAYADAHVRFYDDTKAVREYLNYKSICEYLHFVQIDGGYFVSDFLAL